MTGITQKPPDGATEPLGPDGIPIFQLYDLGGQPGSPTFGLHVDQQGVYWIQKDGGVYRGSRDGVRPAERWTQLTGAYADTMASDDQQLYLLERDKLRFKDKGTGAEGQVPLSWDHTGGALAVDGKYAYAAMVGCPAVTRIDKETLVPEEKYIPNIAVDPVGGVTTLVLRPDGFDCGAWTNVFRADDWAAPARKIVNSAFRLWAMALVGDSLFWLNNPGSSFSTYTSVSRIDVATGLVTNYPDQGGRGGSNFVVSPDQRWLFYTTDSVLWAFSTIDYRQVVVWPGDPTGRRLIFFGNNLSSDGEALYYLAFRDTETRRVYGVHKVPFTYLLDRIR